MDCLGWGGGLKVGCWVGGVVEVDEVGECKSWTLNSGLDHGLDFGLEYGLNS